MISGIDRLCEWTGEERRRTSVWKYSQVNRLPVLVLVLGLPANVLDVPVVGLSFA